MFPNQDQPVQKFSSDQPAQHAFQTQWSQQEQNQWKRFADGQDTQSQPMPNVEQLQRGATKPGNSQQLQDVKIYTSGFFKGEARYQFLRDLKHMIKDGWRLHTITDEGVGSGQEHTGRYKVIYEK